ncbi:MAG: hypothetical protein AAFO29_24670 [Actinomycetota bacterium]
MDRLLPALAAIVCGIAAAYWIRSAIRRQGVAKRLAGQKIDPDIWRLADGDYRRDLHTAVFSVLSTLALIVVALVRIGFWPSVASRSSRCRPSCHWPGGTTWTSWPASPAIGPRSSDGFVRC